MLPAVAGFNRTARQIFAYTVLLVATSLALAPIAHFGPLYISVAAVLGGIFLVLAVQLWRQLNPRAAMRLFRYSITYLTVLFVAMGVDALIRR